MSIVTLPDNFQTADKFVGEHKIPWPVVFDSGQVLMSYLRVTPVNPQVHFPHLFLIDKEGVIRNDFEGTDDQYLSLEGLSKEIDSLVK
jgi:peroxiredoxin